MTKSELRKIYLEKRKNLSESEILRLSEKIFENFISKFQPTENQNVHIFLSIKKRREIHTPIFMDYFFENKIKVFVPKIVGNTLISIELTPETKFIVNSWGISEPETDEDSGVKNFDFVIAPLLYCDDFGNRIGYGKGFYDRFFAEINSNAKKIGVNFFNPSEKIDDISDFDVRLDYLVTPAETLSFTGLE
ncbi:MAG: 5-formyltetrahydrofolate cyclo-ligase [Flavobacteriaceae bacterium]|jgi:5-formyltetrahydrofolate cyclo-ligase|nr:5-formyltetrahydrofolate cyclo-ligase [Flavobacteriaceae bacterium]